MKDVTFGRMWFLVLLLGSAGFAQAQDRPKESGQRDDIPRLIEELGDDNQEVRQAATDKLIEIGDPALPAVRKAVDSSDPEVSHRARTILGVAEMKSRLGLSDKLLRSIPDIYLRLAEGASGADVYRVFVEVTRVETEDIGKSLHEFEPADAGKLAGLMAAREFSGMRDDEKEVFGERCGGMVHLLDGSTFFFSDLRLSATAPHLVLLLKDGNARVRWATGWALGSLDAKEVVPDLVPLLKDGNWEVRQIAALALGYLGAKEYAKDIVPLLKDGDEGVRLTAAEALGSLDAKEHAKDIVPLLKDGSKNVRGSAARTLGNLGDKEVAPALVPLLKDGDADVCRATALALGYLGAKEHVNDFVPLLKDENKWVRILAGIALVELGKADVVAANPNVVEEIKRLAEDKKKDYSKEMRIRAARAMEKLGVKNGYFRGENDK